MNNKQIMTSMPLSMKRIIALVLNYCLGYLYIYPKLGYLFLQYMNVRSALLITVVQFFIYLVVMLITIIMAFPLLKESYFSWKKNKSLILKKNLRLLFGLYIMSFICSFMISIFTQTTTSNNQIGVSSSIIQFPFLMAFTTMIFAPIVEEILFRGVFYRCFRAHYGYLISTVVSCVAFGFIHIYDSLFQGIWTDCWYLLVYATIAFFLCRSYEETDTIYGAMLLHFFNNAIAFLAIIL